MTGTQSPKPWKSLDMVRGDKGEEKGEIKGEIKGYQVSAIGGIARKMDVHQRF